MAAQEPIPVQRRLGFPTTVRVNPITDTVLTTATRILDNNPNRIFWLAVNLSVNKGYVGWDPQVSVNRGIPIAPSGGYVSCTLEEDGELVIHEVWAVLENASGVFYVLEIMAR